MAGSKPQDNSALDVAIIGGGIVGLIQAIGLRSRGINVAIYEQSRGLQEIGAGIAFTANAVECMRRIDESLVSALDKVTTGNRDGPNPNDWLRYCNGHSEPQNLDTGDSTLIFKLYAGEKGFEGCHRAHLLDELMKLVPLDCLKLGKHLKDLSQKEKGPIEMSFADGSKAYAHAVIGCDGIKSRVRQLVLGEHHPACHAAYTHKVCFRGLIPMEKAEPILGKFAARHQHMYMGNGSHMIHFPIAGHSLINVAAFVSDPKDWPLEDGMDTLGHRTDVEAAFADFATPVRSIIKLLPETLKRWAIFDTYQNQIPFYNANRICLAGDAAHAAAPHHGAGAGIGVEDCLCMSTLMEEVQECIAEDPTMKEIALCAAFEAFTLTRRDRCHWLVESSHKVCDIYEGQNPETGSDPEKCKQEIEWRSHKLWYFDIEQMLKEAKICFQQCYVEAQRGVV